MNSHPATTISGKCAVVGLQFLVAAWLSLTSIVLAEPINSIADALALDEAALAESVEFEIEAVFHRFLLVAAVG